MPPFRASSPWPHASADPPVPLLVVNFEQQSIVSRQEIRDAVLALPKTHIRGINMIRYDPFRTIASTLAYVGQNPAPISSHGLFYYDQEFAVIVLFRFAHRAAFLHVLYHEIGHFVFLRVLSQADRDQWMYRIRPQFPDTVTPYAHKNSREDFAECYAFFCTQPDRLRQFPQRFTFFAEQVFPPSP